MRWCDVTIVSEKHEAVANNFTGRACTVRDCHAALIMTPI
jgi:hypothetical protein